MATKGDASNSIKAPTSRYPTYIIEASETGVYQQDHAEQARRALAVERWRGASSTAPAIHA